jgi:hypothetical protein
MISIRYFILQVLVSVRWCEVIDIRPNFVNVQTTTAKSIAKLVSNVVVNLDEIRPTALNLKLTTQSSDCNNTLQLDWYNYERDTSSILGYKVFVREYADNKPFKNWPYETKYNHYNSKLIGIHQNRFKLKNLLRANNSYYLVCLVIFTHLKTSDEVKLEKKCLNVALPSLPSNFSNSFDFCLNSSTTTPFSHATKTLNSTRDFFNKTLNKTFLGLKTKKFPADLFSDSYLFQCKNYTNLLIAFSVCGALLAANIFMFTVIIIQNAIKLKLLKTKVRLSKINNQFYCLSSNSSSYSLRNVEEKPAEQRSCYFCCICLGMRRLWSCFKNICCDMSEMREITADSAVIQRPNVDLKANHHRSNLNLSSCVFKNSLSGQENYPSAISIPNHEATFNNLAKPSKTSLLQEAFNSSNLSSTKNNNNSTSTNEGYILNFPLASHSAFLSSYPNLQEQQQMPQSSAIRSDYSYPLDMSFVNQQQRFVAQAAASNPIMEHPTYDFSFYNPNQVGGSSASFLRNYSNFTNEVFFNAPPSSRFSSSNIQVSSAF